jgi:large subunit ribosomal protein L9
MKVILLENADRLGKRGNVVDVAPGYARNFLIPKGFALEFTPGNYRTFEEQKKLDSVRENKERRKAQALAADLDKVSLTAVVQAGEDDELFGSVTARDISDLLTKEGYTIDRQMIVLEEPIRKLGVYNIGIHLHQDVQARVKLWVVSR